MELKYIKHSKVGFILWPRTDELWHSHMQRAMPRLGGIESAGFARVDGGIVKCWGRSESLGIGSHPTDSEALAKQLGLKGGGAA